MKHAAALLLLCSSIFADGPLIVGSPSLRVKVGNPPLVHLTVKDAPEGSVTTWAGDIGGTGVAVETKTGLSVATVPGAHSFRCILQTPKDGLDPLTILDVVVVVEKSDGTVPIPPPPPVVDDFPTKLTKAVAASPKESHEGLGRVAKLYETVADQIKGGLLKTPEAVTTFTDSLAPVASPAWSKIKADVVDPHLKTLSLKTASDYEPLWRQIAAAVKAGLTDTPPPVVVDPPLPVQSLHVLVVEEMDDRSRLPASQVNIFTSTNLRKWFVENNAQWRMFDDDVDQSKLEAKWRDALSRPRASLPWATVSNGRTGWEGPLPTTETEFIQILERHK